jgi:anti-sigma regulatory factor (Ser/Thr protein kinase)
MDAALLDTLFATAPVGFAFFGPDLRCRRVNDALTRMGGVPADLMETLHFVLATGEPRVNVEVAEGPADGHDEMRHWQISCYPVRDRQRSGPELLGVAAILADVTEQKRVEEALRESQKQTRIFLKDMMFTMSEGRLWLCDGSEEMPTPLPGFGEPITLTARTLRDIRRLTVDASEEMDMPPERWQDFVAGVGEGAMNAVVHGNGGVGRVCADLPHGKVQVWIEDGGTGIATHNLHRATLERGYTTTDTLGHGFWIMLKTCDRVYLSTGPEGTTLVLEQSRTAPEPSWMEQARPLPPPRR